MRLNDDKDAVIFKTTKIQKQIAIKTAKDNGMTISGMIRFAVKKVFGINI